MKYLINLNVRSNYSFLSSAISLSNYLEFAKQNDLKSLALTDENVMYGAYEFYQMCQQAKIKPLIGLDCQWQYTEDKIINLTLFSINYQGYQKLGEISSFLNQAQTFLSNKEIEQYLTNNRDLVIIIKVDNYRTNHLSHFLATFSKHHHDLIYLGVNQANIAFYEELKLITNNIVPVNTVKYLKSNDVQVYQALQAIKQQTTLTTETMLEHGSDYYLTQEELINFFPSEVLKQINGIVNLCTWEFPALTNQQKIENLPQFVTPDGSSSIEYFKTFCRKQFFLRVPASANQKIYQQRLNYEVNIIIKMGFTDYFLIVADYVDFARKQGIYYGPGRGSAAGSLVAFILQITEIDPVKYNLIFERFLNPERSSFPDIDIDFQDERREEIIQYLAKKYGADHVAHIVTFQTMACKMALRDLGRVFNLSLTEVNEISKLIPLQYNFNLKLALKNSPKLMQYREKYKLLFQIASLMIGFPRQTSTHAAGIILTKAPLTTYVPIQKGFNNVVLSQYPMDDLEKIGLIKMDILGLRNLTILANICEKVHESYHVQIDLSAIPLDNAKTFQILQNGDTTGIFQLESPGMRQILIGMKTNSLEDIIACSSLFRPGPQDYIPTYINRKLGKEKVHYLHPDLAPILATTYGIIVYQEQILLILQKIANYSLAKADVIRRAIGKKDRIEMNLQKNEFITAAIQNGYPSAVVKQIWADIEQFAGYGFNRAHAVAYSLIGYQLAYLKANYPLAFMTCLLTSVIGNDQKLLQYLHECQKYQIKILPPSINYSQSDFAIDSQKQAIIYSLLAIKQMSQVTCHYLLNERKKNGLFNSFFQFCARAIYAGLNRRNLEFLIAAGALDEIEANRTMLLANLDNALKYAQVVQSKDKNGVVNRLNFTLHEPTFITCPFDEISASSNEYRALGLYLKYNPELTWKQQLDPNHQTINFNQLGNFTNQSIMVIGQMISIKTIKTKNQQLMAFAVFQGDNIMVEATIFPKVYQLYQSQFQINKVLLMDAKVNFYQDKTKLIIEKVIKQFQTK